MADKTYRRARESYELAITLAAKVTPDSNGRFPDMPEKQRQQIIEAANLWAKIAETHATLSLCDRITRQCRTITRAMSAAGIITPGEAQIHGSNVDDEFELEDDQ